MKTCLILISIILSSYSFAESRLDRTPEDNYNNQDQIDTGYEDPYLEPAIPDQEEKEFNDPRDSYTQDNYNQNDSNPDVTQDEYNENQNPESDHPESFLEDSSYSASDENLAQ